MNCFRTPIQILAELGPMISNDRRLAVEKELAANPNVNEETIRTRLPLYGVSAEVIEQVVVEFRKRREGRA